MKAPDETKAEFLDAVRQGVFEAVREALPTIDRSDIEGAISHGVNLAMPFEPEILSAITKGVKEAMRENKTKISNDK